MSEETQTLREMPKYECHKVVHALKIGKVETNEDNDLDIFFEEGAGYESIRVDGEAKHRIKSAMGKCPDDLGYYVRYKGGYESWSPTKAFEEGYSKI